MLLDFLNFAVLNLAIVARQFVEMTRIRIEVINLVLKCDFIGNW